METTKKHAYKTNGRFLSPTKLFPFAPIPCLSVPDIRPACPSIAPLIAIQINRSVIKLIPEMMAAEHPISTLCARLGRTTRKVWWCRWYASVSGGGEPERGIWIIFWFGSKLSSNDSGRRTAQNLKKLYGLFNWRQIGTFFTDKVQILLSQLLSFKSFCQERDPSPDELFATWFHPYAKLFRPSTSSFRVFWLSLFIILQILFAFRCAFCIHPHLTWG